MSTHAGGPAAPAVGTASGLQSASAGPRCCAFRAAGARARGAMLICRCLAAVPQVCTSCSTTQLLCPHVHPRALAVRMPAFSGQSVQRWPRTRRSSDPLQQRGRRLHLPPEAVVSHRDLESAVGIRVRTRPGRVADASAPFSTSTPHLGTAGPAHSARAAGDAQPATLMPANALGLRQTTHTSVGAAMPQVSTRFCLQPMLSRLRCLCCARLPADER